MDIYLTINKYIVTVSIINRRKYLMNDTKTCSRTESGSCFT